MVRQFSYAAVFEPAVEASATASGPYGDGLIVLVWALFPR
jgi:hypothetical protein